MKLIFAVLDVSLTMGLTRCHKTEGFFCIYILPKRDFGVTFCCNNIGHRIAEITQNDGHYAVQVRSRTPNSVAIENP